MFTAITFIGFTVAVAVLSWYKTKDDNLETQDGYFLAGRGLTGTVIAGSLMLTNLSTEQLIGNSGQAYASNMGPMAWEATSAGALVILALVFLPIFLKSGITTIPEYLEERYDPMVKRIVSIAFLVGYLITYLPTVLYSGALVLNRLFGIEDLLGVSQIDAVTMICVAIGIVGSIYAVFGGLKAVAVSDTINGAGLLIGGLAIPVLAFMALGDGNIFAGVKDLIENIPADKFNAINPADAQAPMIPWPVLFTGLLFNNLFYWCTNQAIIQRTLGAKNLAEAQKGAIFAGFLKLIGPFFITICGIIAFRMFGPNLATPDEAYPMLVLEVLPTWLIGFFAAVLFGAILSSFNSALNSCMTLYTLDIHKPLFKKDATDKELVKIGKIFGVVLAAVSIAVAPLVANAPSGLYDFLQECFGYYNVPILAAVILAFSTKRVPALAPKVALVAHVVLYAGSKFVPFEHIFGFDVHYLYILAVLFPVNILIMLFIGKIAPRETDFIQKNADVVDLTPWKHRKVASAIAVVLMVLLYVLFSPLGLAG